MSHQATYYATAAVAAAGLVGGAYYYRLSQQKYKLPEIWREVGVLKKMYAYPIKSCAPVLLNQAECTHLGLRVSWLRDRILMVVDEKNNFITARAYPELLTVHPTIRNSVLTLKHADMEDLQLNLAEVVALRKQETATVWSVPVPVYDCGWEASEWFSRFLDKSTNNFRLVYYASQQCRPLRGSTNKIYKFMKNDTVSLLSYSALVPKVIQVDPQGTAGDSTEVYIGGALPDEVPFNLINEASVKDLNTSLKDCQITECNFRPNFLLSGAKAYDEDNWKFVKIGENIFEIIKPCTRCIMTTIDPETGVRNSKQEPLETLKSYRQLTNPLERRSAGNSPRMGVQMALRSGPGGMVSLNDIIYVA